MKYKGIILAFIFAVGLTVVYLLSGGVTTSKKGIVAGMDAPFFEAKDLAGNVWSLKDLKGKVVILNFWATWCDTCKMEKPFFNNLYEALKDRGDVVFLSVLYNDEPEKGKQFMLKHSYNFPVLSDEQKISSHYGIRAVPETFVIDKRGVIAQKIVGPMKWDSEEVKEAILRLLKT